MDKIKQLVTHFATEHKVVSIVVIVVIVALLIAWWNYAANCTPVDALYNSNFMPTNSFKKLLFPVVKLYYVILCIFFFLFPMYILLQASILLKNKIT